MPIPCIDFDQKNSLVQHVLTPTCPRFEEDFKNNFLQRWEVIDPIEGVNGPSLWVRRYGLEDRDVVLAQESRIYGNSDAKEGTIYLLKDKDLSKICTLGTFSVKFKAFNEGIVGFIFRYNQKGDYYIIEISGQKEKFVRIRKKIEGITLLISQKPLIGYTIGTWHSVVILMKNDNFNIYMTQNYLHEDKIKVFETNIIDTDLKLGLIGITTHNTKAYFSEVKLSPFDDLESKLNIIF